MVMGHNFHLPDRLLERDIEIIDGPKTFGGQRKGWWRIKYNNRRYKFFGQVIAPDRANEVGYDQLKHIKKLASEAIELKTVIEDDEGI